MTGKDLIIYILENGLENEPLVKDDRFLGFMTRDEAAVRFGVGPATINAWVDYGWLMAIRIGDELYIPKDAVFKFNTKVAQEKAGVK